MSQSSAVIGPPTTDATKAALKKYVLTNRDKVKLEQSRPHARPTVFVQQFPTLKPKAPTTPPKLFPSKPVTKTTPPQPGTSMPPPLTLLDPKASVVIGGGGGGGNVRLSSQIPPPLQSAPVKTTPLPSTVAPPMPQLHKLQKTSPTASGPAQTKAATTKTAPSKKTTSGTVIKRKKH
jgi:hypothetical protein